MFRTKTAALCLTVVFGFVGGVVARAAGEDDVADVPAKDLLAGKDKQKRYFLISPEKDAKARMGGYGLVVILPGALRPLVL